MFVESAFITKEFREEQIPVLENVTSLCVVNKGTSIAIINGVVIYPTQKQILIVPDGTYSKVQLVVNYTNIKRDIPTKKDRNIEIDGDIKTNESLRREIPTKKGSRISGQNKILLIYKKLI
jgi:hypothetical protein